jgi:ornithine cyclodeaminase/alanine dehydrogenase-like protein (mu-crystallin family)
MFSSLASSVLTRQAPRAMSRTAGAAAQRFFAKSALPSAGLSDYGTVIAAFARTQQQQRFFAKSAFPAPRLFDYETVTSNLSVADAIDSVEAAFAALAKGTVDVPMPMHIGIEETEAAGPGDCHIKGGYVAGTKTFTVKLACVSFYKNMEKNLPPGSGVFIVVDAVTGAPLAVFQENRFMTDLRTGAAGAVSLKYTTLADKPISVGFIGCGAIARNMARAAAAIRPDMKGVAYAMAGAEEFAKEMGEELGVPFEVVSSAEELCANSNCIYTQTPGSATVLELGWLKPGTTIIASGSDQPTKQEVPNDVLKASKYISDLTKQTSKVGELRGAIQAGVMTEADVYAELGQVVNGDKAGREGDELIVVDLTGTGAQDAAIGQVAWDKLSTL